MNRNLKKNDELISRIFASAMEATGICLMVSMLWLGGFLELRRASRAFPTEAWVG
jgi:hypothetical protein